MHRFSLDQRQQKSLQLRKLESSLISSKGPISSACGEIRGHCTNNPCSGQISWFLLAFLSPGLFTPLLNHPWPQQAVPSPPPPPPGDFELSRLPRSSPSSSEFSKFQQLYRKGHVCHLGKQGQTGTHTLTLQFVFYCLITALETGTFHCCHF